MPPRLNFSSTPTRSHALYVTRWCDPFEVNTSDGHGWMLLDLPGAPCDVTQPGMRTMSQRLRKAEQCAAAGGKYGLLQAVLLSLDSQPATPAQWVKEAIALEACSRVLLPAAHEVPLDLDAARAAYQQLNPAEQRLWRQLQAARLQQFHDRFGALDEVNKYELDFPYMANVLGGVTENAALLGFQLTRQLLYRCCWSTVCRLSQRYGLVGNPAAPANMQAAYNWVLACYHHHGRDHPETRAALAAAEAADPDAEVPKLLAGLAYPAVSNAPAAVTKSRMEAMGYAYTLSWAASRVGMTGHQTERLMDAFSSYSAALKWLLSARGIRIPTPQQQREIVAVRQLACGYPYRAQVTMSAAFVEAVGLLHESSWPACRARFDQRGAARLLRVMAVSAASMAAATMNLPPLSAAPELWKNAGMPLGLPSLTGMGMRLKTMALVAVNWVPGILEYYGRQLTTVTPAAAAERASGLGFWNPQELGYISGIAPSLTIAGARWLWQCGDATQAQTVCRLERGGVMELLRDAAASKAPEQLQRKVDGLRPFSVQPVKALAAFLSEQSARQPPGIDLELIDSAHRAPSFEGMDMGESMLVVVGDPQEQLLYSSFPAWLNQLVSQVMGRPVTLVVEPQSMHRILEDRPQRLACSIFLKGAAADDVQLFGWRQPGDVSQVAAQKLLMQQAEDRGCTDHDLLWLCPAVEPYAGAPVAGGDGSGGGSSSSAPNRQQQQQPGSSSSGGGSNVKPSRPCAQCGELFPKLKQCARCKAVVYCSRDCQVAHWKAGHKESCQGQPGA